MLSSRLSQSMGFSGIVGPGGAGGPQFRTGFAPGRFGYGRPLRGNSIDENDETSEEAVPQHQQQQQQLPFSSNAGHQSQVAGQEASARTHGRSQQQQHQQSGDLGHRVDSSSTCGSAPSLPSSPVLAKGDFLLQDEAAPTLAPAGASMNVGFPSAMERACSNEVDDIVSPFAFSTAPVGHNASHDNYALGFAATSPPANRWAGCCRAMSARARPPSPPSPWPTPPPRASSPP